MTTTRSIPGRHASRRGSAYLLFLGTATIVVLIGLAAIAFTRAEVRRAVQAARLDEARSLAESAVAQAMLLINGTDTWRSRLTNDAWSSEQTLGTGTLSWKLVDETTGDLTADESATVRVYGRGTVGETVYVCSVLVRPPPTLASIAASKADLITNGSLDSGTSGWSGVDCTLGTNSGNPPSSDGEPMMTLKNRANASGGPTQVLARPLVEGTTYAFECEARIDGSADNVWAGIWVDTSAGGEWFELVNTGATGTWATYSAVFTPTWDGDFVSATLSMGTQSVADDLYVDGVKLISQPPVTVGPVAGTWRREPN